MKKKERKCDYEVHNTTPVTKAFIKWRKDKNRKVLDYGEGLDLRERYVKWLDEKVKVERIGPYFHIVIPFMTTTKEPIHIYAIKQPNRVFLTDDCKTIRSLKERGYHFSAKRKRHIEFVLEQNGLSLDKDAIVCEILLKDFAKQLHNMVQAVFLIDGLFTIEQSEDTD